MPNNIKNEHVSNDKSTAFVDDKKIYNKKIKPTPKPEQNIGIDTKNVILNNITSEGYSQALDISSIQSFTSVSQSRDQIYTLIDTMCEDSRIASALEIYAQDGTEYNDSGKIIWCESADTAINNYVTYLLETMNADKNAYKWMLNLCKYGDLYLKLYRQSDYDDDELFVNGKSDRQKLNEDVNVIAYSKNDHYTGYVEMMPNPAEMFELVKHGKTYAYVKADISSQSALNKTGDALYTNLMKYKFNRNDVDLHGASDFVHASLEDNTSRTPEEVSIFIPKDEFGIEGKEYNYSVKRGQSVFYSQYKIWREMNLLENAMLLNRVTKSSIVRVVQVEVGDMPKENVGPHLQGIKSLMEQKTALNAGNSMTEYNNAGPIENNVYIPTHGGVGNISTQEIGGDPNVKGLDDINYFKNKLYAGLKIPKQFLGDTDDAAGFNGGSSLAIQSSRYAKTVKHNQNALLQALTDAINLMCIDAGLPEYVNKFELHMVTPTTQEEIDRRSNLQNKVSIARDVMQLLETIPDDTIKLQITKQLISGIINDGEALQLIQNAIDEMEAEKEEQTMKSPEDDGDTKDTDKDTSSDDDIMNLDIGMDEPLDSAIDSFGSDESNNAETAESENTESSNDETAQPLPRPSDLGIDFSDSSNF